jgi:hypothetical protein
MVLVFILFNDLTFNQFTSFHCPKSVSPETRNKHQVNTVLKSNRVFQRIAYTKDVSIYLKTFKVENRGNSYMDKVAFNLIKASLNGTWAHGTLGG